MPSIVCYKSKNDIVVGQIAQDQGVMRGPNTIYDAKRLIGRTFSDPVVTADRKLWPFTVIDSGNNKPQIQL